MPAEKLSPLDRRAGLSPAQIAAGDQLRAAGHAWQAAAVEAAWRNGRVFYTPVPAKLQAAVDAGNADARRAFASAAKEQPA